MLVVDNLHVEVAGQPVLKGLTLTVNPGEVHAIMGPNGSGKSTLAKVLAGHEDYEVTEGSITFQGKDLLELEAHERACEGVFLAFQYPVEIPGVPNKVFLKAAVNSVRKHRGLDELDALGFLKLYKENLKLVDMSSALSNRDVNAGFSGGEKKRNEILQMALMDPTLAVLDETDSGLDIDALRAVSNGVNALRRPDRSIVLITHYQRLLDHIEPDVVHVLKNGQIALTGGPELAQKLEAQGYDWVNGEPCAA